MIPQTAAEIHTRLRDAPGLVRRLLIIARIRRGRRHLIARRRH